MEEPNTNENKVKEDAKNKALEALRGMKATVVNIEDIAEAEARKAADAYMTESKDKKKDGWIKRIWKHSFVDSFYRQREVGRVREEIKNSGNIYSRRVSEENSKNADEGARLAVAERFTSEYDDQVILSKGEERKILDNNPENIQTKNEIQNLIKQYATDNSLTKESFNESKTRILNNLKSQDLLKGANSYADNLFEIAQNARLAIEHGAKMDELQLGTDVIIGKAKSSLKTEAHYNKIDQITDAVKNSKFGKYISPAVLSTALGIGYSITVVASKKFASSKLVAYGTLGAAVGISTVWAGMDKSHSLAKDRKQHGLEMAEGGKYEEGSEKREQINQYQYGMENSKDLAQRLRDVMFEKDKDGNDIPKDINQQDLDEILANLANIDARKSLNAKNKIDLISYSNVGSVEKESTDLTILTARAKYELEKKISSGLLNIPNGESFDAFLAKQTQVVENTLLGGEEGITNKDKAFGKFRTKEVAKKMVMTAVIGFTVGALVQEGVHVIKDHVVSALEGGFGWHMGANVDSQTPLEHFRGWITGHPSHMNIGNPAHWNMNGREFVLPEGTSIEPNPDGTFNILQGKDVKFGNLPLHFGVNGHLDDTSVNLLGHHGIVATEGCMPVDGAKEVTGSAEDYIKNHPGGTNHVSRGVNGLMHYDNDTPKPVFELNEQKLDWGGAKGLDTNGNYVFNMSRMTSGGSFHEQFSVDAQEKMKNGGLKMLLSLTQGTQHNVFEVPIDQNGNAIVDPNSEVGKLFFGTENGHAIFKGRFAEVAETFGTKDGVEHVRILSTFEGPGNNTITQIVPVPESIPTTDLNLPLDTEPPMYIPFFVRKPLEPVTYDENGKVVEKPDKKVVTDEIIPVDKKDGKDTSVDYAIPVDKIDKIEKQKTINEISQEEYDGMYDDLKMLNKRIQDSKGIITLSKSDFKSLYGQKRYMDLKSILAGIPVEFNKTELQTIGDELEGLLSKSKIISKEELEEREREKNKAKTIESDIKSDLEMLNKAIRESKGIITLEESDFKSDLGKEKYKKLKSIPDGKGFTFNKEELPKMGDELEKYLINYQKIMSGKVEPAPTEKEMGKGSFVVDQYGQAVYTKKENVKGVQESSQEKEPIKPATPENTIATPEIKKTFIAKDLEKVGTKFETKEGLQFTVTKFIKPWFGSNKVESILKDKNGKEYLVSYKIKQLEEEFKKGNIKITKIEEGK